jgi:uncharacterized membrane protein YfcA
VSIALVMALAAFGLLVGTLSGLLGVGGIFHCAVAAFVAGLAQHEAQATSLVVVLPTAMVGSWTLHRNGLIDVRRAPALGSIGTVGALVGVGLALPLSATMLRILFAILLGAVGVRLIRDASRMPRSGRLPRSRD